MDDPRVLHGLCQAMQGPDLRFFLAAVLSEPTASWMVSFVLYRGCTERGTTNADTEDTLRQEAPRPKQSCGIFVCRGSDQKSRAWGRARALAREGTAAPTREHKDSGQTSLRPSPPAATPTHAPRPQHPPFPSMSRCTTLLFRPGTRLRLEIKGLAGRGS